MGFRLRWLGTDLLLWSELLAIVMHAPDDSALMRARQGRDYQWDLTNQLLAGIADILAAANWQRGGDENAKRPERIERPGVKKQQTEGQVLAQGKAMSIENMNRRLGWD